MPPSPPTVDAIDGCAGDGPDSSLTPRWWTIGPGQLKCGTASFFLHGLFVAALFLQLPRLAPQPSDEPEPAHGPFFVPIHMTELPAPRPDVTPSPNALQAAPQSAPEPVEAAPPVDLSSIQLSFAPDLNDELPGVVQTNQGMLALTDKDDTSVTRYLMSPPEWEVREDFRDISGMFRIRMDPPQKWAVFRGAAQRYGLDLDRYRAGAVFNISYRHCLQAAIRSSLPANETRRVSSVRLAVTPNGSCGIQVLEVSFATDQAPNE